MHFSPSLCYCPFSRQHVPVPLSGRTQGTDKSQEFGLMCFLFQPKFFKQFLPVNRNYFGPKTVDFFGEFIGKIIEFNSYFLQKVLMFWGQIHNLVYFLWEKCYRTILGFEVTKKGQRGRLGPTKNFGYVLGKTKNLIFHKIILSTYPFWRREKFMEFRYTLFRRETRNCVVKVFVSSDRKEILYRVIVPLETTLIGPSSITNIPYYCSIRIADKPKFKSSDDGHYSPNQSIFKIFGILPVQE